MLAVEEQRAVDGGVSVMEAKMEVRKGISPDELEQLGGGEVAYIKMLTSEEANEIYPLDDSLPEGISIYALHAADGTGSLYPARRKRRLATILPGRSQARHENRSSGRSFRGEEVGVYGCFK